MKIAYFGELTQENEQHIKDALPGVDLVAHNGPLSSAPSDLRDADIVSVFIDSKATKETIDAFPNLVCIAARSAGVDHIDIETCKKMGIAVANVPRYGEITVAEHAFALILSLSRKLFQSYERTEKMNFSRDGLEGFDLYGKTIGVIGCGNIGRHVIKIAKGFGMNVAVFDIRPDNALAQQIGFAYKKSFEEVLSVSDVLTLHIPYTAQNHHLINKQTIKQIKKGSILINTARGGLVETAALMWALEEGILAGAGLDVLEGEYDTYDRIRFMSQNPTDPAELQLLVRNQMLVSRDNVIITPHNAYNSIEAVNKIFRTTIENIQAFIAGNPINIIQ